MSNLFLLQSDFFITYILTNGMSGFSLEVLQFCLLTWQFLKAYSLGHSKETLNFFPFKGHGAIELASLTGPAESKIVLLLAC